MMQAQALMNIPDQNNILIFKVDRCDIGPISFSLFFRYRYDIENLIGSLSGWRNLPDKVFFSVKGVIQYSLENTARFY